MKTRRIITPLINLRTNIDNKRLMSDRSSIVYYEEHLQNCIHQPMVSLIAEQQFLGEQLQKNRKTNFSFNIFKKFYVSSDLQSKLELNLKNMYPNTIGMRKFLIRKNRFKLHEVLPDNQKHIITKLQYIYSKMLLK